MDRVSEDFDLVSSSLSQKETRPFATIFDGSTGDVFDYHFISSDKDGFFIISDYDGSNFVNKRKISEQNAVTLTNIGGDACNYRAIAVAKSVKPEYAGVFFDSLSSRGGGIFFDRTFNDPVKNRDEFIEYVGSIHGVVQTKPSRKPRERTNKNLKP